MQDSACTRMDMSDIPNSGLLEPPQPHPSHILSQNMLLYSEHSSPLVGNVSVCYRLPEIFAMQCYAKAISSKQYVAWPCAAAIGNSELARTNTRGTLFPCWSHCQTLPPKLNLLDDGTAICLQVVSKAMYPHILFPMPTFLLSSMGAKQCLQWPGILSALIGGYFHPTQ